MSNIGNTTSETMIRFGAKSGLTCAAMVSLPITRCRDLSKVIPIWISRRCRELQQARVGFCVRLELFVGRVPKVDVRDHTLENDGGDYACNFRRSFWATIGDFHLLARGTDADSKPFAEGWFAVFFKIRGDRKLVADALHYPRWNMNGDMCFNDAAPLVPAPGLGGTWQWTHRGRTQPQHVGKSVLIIAFFFGSWGYISPCA